MRTLRKTLVDTSPFHHAEQAVQARLGVREAVEPWARRAVRPFMPEQHREFYAQLPFVVAAARDAAGQPWATLLVGTPSFISSPDDTSLQIAASVLPGDALAGALTAGAEVGLLGIELETRRRNRVNGTISEAGTSGLTFVVDQSFGNCPQYITPRSWHHVEVRQADVSVSHHQQLTSHMQKWITSSDTLFIASGYRRANEHRPPYGMDASHRGGAAGFVKVVDASRLVLPDYSGNNHFNTIGNLVADPRVGLLFVDFANGNLLQISGRATIDWDSAEVAKHPGAQRLITIAIEHVVQLNGVLPLRWDAPAGSMRALQLVAKTKESADVTSFEFVAHDGGDLADFKAGQHLPIEVRIEGHAQPFKRTYSLSNAPAEGRYRISVKREPHGLVSGYLHDKLDIGAVINADKPNGDFVLEHSDGPVALVSVGIGVTPMVSMLKALTRKTSNRLIYFIHGVRDGAHHPLVEEVRAIAQRNDNVRLETLYSQPRDSDVKGMHYDRRGHVGIELLQELVPELDANFYLCGPASFLANIVAGLGECAVAPDRIHTETF